MSEVKRYSVASDYGYSCERYEDPKGEFVDYKDYARLQAEVQRLRASSFVTAVPVEQYMRVIKAWDAMCRVMVSHHGKVGVVDDWNAAKEGKPSV